MSFFKKWLDKDAVDMVSNASTIGLHLVSGTFVGLAMGYFLDEWLVVTKPWLTMGFLILGIAAGFKNVWIDVKRIQRIQDAQNAHGAQDVHDVQGPAPGSRDSAGQQAGPLSRSTPPSPHSMGGQKDDSEPGSGRQGGQNLSDR